MQQQYHLKQMNSQSNSRLSSSKPILSGAVAGQKYLNENIPIGKSSPQQI